MPPLTPHLFVEDMQRSIAFYRDVLGFEVRRAEPEVAPTFASLQRADSSLMLSPFGETFGNWKVADVAEQRRGQLGPVSFYIEGADLEADYQRVLDAGATVVDPLAARPWGQREFTVADPDGFLWAIWKV